MVILQKTTPTARLGLTVPLTRCVLSILAADPPSNKSFAVAGLSRDSQEGTAARLRIQE